MRREQFNGSVDDAFTTQHPLEGHDPVGELLKDYNPSKAVGADRNRDKDEACING